MFFYIEEEMSDHIDTNMMDSSSFDEQVDEDQYGENIYCSNCHNVLLYVVMGDIHTIKCGVCGLLHTP